MKKLLAVALASLALAIPVSASVEDVEKFLEPYVEETSEIEVKEFCDPENESKKTLLITYQFENFTSTADSHISGYIKRNRLFQEMISQDWFDYSGLQFLKCSDFVGMGIVEYSTYLMNDGVYVNYSTHEAFPWIIRTEDEIEEDKRMFLGSVAAELLNSYGVFSGDNYHLYNGEWMDIQTCYNLAIVSGTVTDEDKTYDFTFEFKYRFRDRYDGTYETIYANINNLTLTGELKPIEDYVWEDF